LYRSIASLTPAGIVPSAVWPGSSGAPSPSGTVPSARGSACAPGSVSRPTPDP
jgi:hypothetical protein